METSAFSRLLDEYRCTMMQRCPAYRLDCVMEETLCDILTNWNYGFGIAFQECKMELYKDGLARCRKSFEYNQALAEKILEGNIPFDRPEWLCKKISWLTLVWEKKRVMHVNV